MRVLLDYRMAEWTGVGRYSRGLAAALAAREDLDLVLLAGQAAADVDAEQVNVPEDPFSLGGSRSYANAVAQLQPDVVHSLHSPVPLPARGTLVTTLHDLIPLRVPGSMPSALRRAVYRRVISRAVNVSTRILADSRHAAVDLAGEFPRAAGKTRTALLGVDDFAAGPKGELPEGVPAQEPYILSFGSTRPHKGLELLLEAYSADYLSNDHNLVLVGPQTEGRADSVLGESPGANGVFFTGPVDDAALRELYSRAAVFVHPSAYEGFGFPPLEAMSMGTPVVCSDAASLPEVVGDAAMVFASGDVQALRRRISDVLGSVSLGADLSRRGLARACGFTWQRCAEATVAVYREAYEEGKRGRHA